MVKMFFTDPMSPDLSPGMKVHLQELQNVDSRAVWTKLTQEEKGKLVQALQRHRECKATGMHSRVLAEMADVQHTINCIEREVCKLLLHHLCKCLTNPYLKDLCAHCNMSSFTVTVPISTGMSFGPSFYNDEVSAWFLEFICGISWSDFTLKFHSFAVARIKGEYHVW